MFDVCILKVKGVPKRGGNPNLVICDPVYLQLLFLFSAHFADDNLIPKLDVFLYVANFDKRTTIKLVSRINTRELH